MDNKKVMIIALLIVAIAFSAASIMLNFSVQDLDTEPVKLAQEVPQGKSNGNINIVIEDNFAGDGQ